MKFIHLVCPTGDFKSMNGGLESFTTLDFHSIMKS